MVVVMVVVVVVVAAAAAAALFIRLAVPHPDREQFCTRLSLSSLPQSSLQSLSSSMVGL